VKGGRAPRPPPPASREASHESRQQPRNQPTPRRTKSGDESTLASESTPATPNAERRTPPANQRRLAPAQRPASSCQQLPPALAGAQHNANAGRERRLLALVLLGGSYPRYSAVQTATSCAIRGPEAEILATVCHRLGPGSRGELGWAGCAPKGPTWPLGRWVRWPGGDPGQHSSTGAGSSAPRFSVADTPPYRRLPPGPAGGG
jgi:hypothetical protein